MGMSDKEDHEREAMIDSLRCRRGEPTLYEAPGKKRLWALYGLNLMHLSSAAHIVGTAMIWHANHYTGRCDPSFGTLAYEAGQSRRTVIRAIKELERKGILRPQQRWRHGHQTSNAYHLNWNKLERKFCHFEKLVKEHSAIRGSDKICQMVVTKTVWGSVKPVTLTHERTHEVNPCHEMAHSPIANDATFVESPSTGDKQKARSESGVPKGYQGEPVEAPR
jgi:hypothetical protein